MQNFLLAACRFAVALLLAAAALALARVGVWAAGAPAWWTLPAAAALFLLVYGPRLIRRVIQDQREAFRLLGETSFRPDPAAESRMRLTWRAGERRLGKDGCGSPRPGYICLGPDNRGRRQVIGLASPPGQEDPEGEFAWRFGTRAVWLDLDFAWEEDPGQRWPLFLDQLSRRGGDSLAGVVAMLDADFFLRGDEEELRAAAGVLRQRLTQIQNSASLVLPVYLLINRIDRLYGMRSVASALDARRLSRPLGDFRLLARETLPGFVRRVLGRAEDALSVHGASSSAAGAAAACQAAEELARLTEPLTFFCQEALGDHADAGTPGLRGLFFGSTGPEGTVAPPLLPLCPGTAAVAEPAAARVWFWSDLVRELLPADARPAPPVPGRGRAARARAGLTGLLCGTLALCWLLTWSFVEARTVLLAAAGKIEFPSSPDHLEPLLELASLTHNRNRGWWLPRFGMREAEALEEEIKNRFIDSYFDLKTIPHIENVQDLALTAADSQNPLLVGQALLRLMIARDGISRCLDPGAGAPGSAAFLKAMAGDMNISTPGETRQLENFYAWAGPRDWMPATRDALTGFERYIVDKASGGSLLWIINWVESLPGMRRIDTGSVWDPQPPAGPDPVKRSIDPAWTADAYRIVRSLLDAVVYSDDDAAAWRKRRDAFLAEYRREAKEQWRRAADELWSRFRETVSDRHLRALTRQAMRGDDPAARFYELIREHLLPMFDGDASDPDIEWLRRYQELFVSAPRENDPETPAAETRIANFIGRLAGAAREFGSDDGLSRWSRRHLSPRGKDAAGEGRAEADRFVAAVRRIGVLAESAESNLTAVRNQFRRWSADARHLPISAHEPFGEAAAAAEALHRHLAEATGGNAWNSLSPLTRYNYIRYLTTRQAAMGLDALWRETVYNPYHTAAGGGEEEDADPGRLLGKFLNGPALGFWKLEEGRVATSAWDRIPFMLSSDFLSFCNQTLSAGRMEEALTLPFRVDAVSVDEDAKERPLYVEFLVTGKEGGEEKVVYRNYTATGAFTWRRGDKAEVGVEIVFSSFRLRRRLAGDNALSDFVRKFDSGVWTLEADGFPEHAGKLASLGISRVSIRGSFRNRGDLLRHAGKAAATLPRSIVSTGVEEEEAQFTPGMIAQAVWGGE